MLPQEIRDIIKKEAKQFCRTEGKPDVILSSTEYSLAGLVAYTAAANKYAELMIEFAEWVHDNYFGVHQYKGGWKWMKLGGSPSDLFSTSDLLTIFFKEKSKS